MANESGAAHAPCSAPPKIPRPRAKRQRSTFTPFQNATCPAMFLAASFGSG